jgi:DNA-binding transcriptional regulator GbsR (MarR family)
LDTIQQSLGISKGSTSQALNTLKRQKAIKPVYIQGDRRDHYEPETQLRRLISGFLNEQVLPHLETNKNRLEHIETLASQDAPSSSEIRARLKRLNRWVQQSEKVLPLLTQFFGKENT